MLFQQHQELRKLTVPLPPTVEHRHVRGGEKTGPRSPKINFKIGDPVSVSFPIGVGGRKAGFNCPVQLNTKENKS